MWICGVGAYNLQLFGSVSYKVLEALLLFVLLMDDADEYALEFFISICQIFVKTVKTNLNLD